MCSQVFLTTNAGGKHLIITKLCFFPHCVEGIYGGLSVHTIRMLTVFDTVSTEYNNSPEGTQITYQILKAKHFIIPFWIWWQQLVSKKVRTEQIHQEEYLTANYVNCHQVSGMIGYEKKILERQSLSEVKTGRGSPVLQKIKCVCELWTKVRTMFLCLCREDYWTS